MGQPLVVRVGDAVDVLETLRAAHDVVELLSHEETGGGWTYDRDLRVAAWARDKAVDWTEMRQNGVIRAIGSRDGWAKRWDAFMARPIAAAPDALAPIPGMEPGDIPTAAELGLDPDRCPERQAGGRPEALALLDSFLETRGVDYRRAMSSPLAGWDACSRLSPHFAWGTISSREAAQALWAAKDRVRGLGRDAHPGHAGSLKSFEGRLHWRCHFMQKLEREPRLEFENQHPAYDAIRNGPPEPERLERWFAGQTGWPFVDACMRALRATGWMNFRMRAMLMATASYHLWMHWREPSVRLARLFTDFEPGIHYPQSQMQSGVTGINTVRIYNPVKQGLDQDPDAEFIARWVPELAGLDPRDRHEPWRVGGAAG
ncbi:MAG: FAD-binding domain-containing protein, partial [Pseudomonadota bacterium]